MIILLIALGLKFCNSESNQVNQFYPPITENSNNEFQKNSNQKDTINYDSIYLPDWETTSLATILITGEHHFDEVPDSAHLLKWFGVFKNGEKNYISKTKILTKRIHDPIIDEDESEKTGWYIETSINDTSIILISGIDFLINRRIEPAILGKSVIWPGDSIEIKYQGISYLLFATGGKRFVQSEPEWFEVWNYKLFIKAQIGKQNISQILVASPMFDDAMIEIKFAGDIDGDKILDLIIDTSNDYNAVRPTLYLSKIAGNGELLKLIGIHISTGC